MSRLHQLKDFIKIYDGAIPSNWCQKIITAFDTDDEHHIKSTIGSGGTDDYREAIEMNCTKRVQSSPKWDSIMRVLNHHAAESYKRYRSDIEKDGFPKEQLFKTVTLEQWRMHRYDKNTHYYKEHIDSIESTTAIRMLVLLYYLNTVEEGGETSFDSIKMKVKPVEGRLVVAPTWFGYPHSAEIPISNKKYMIKTYIHYPGKGYD